MKLPDNIALYCTPNESWAQAAIARARFYSLEGEIEALITHAMDNGIPERQAALGAIISWNLQDPMLTETETGDIQ